jgi:hypothetical protein
VAVATIQAGRCRSCGVAVGPRSAMCGSCRTARQQRALDGADAPRPTPRPAHATDESVAFASGLLIGLTAVFVSFTMYVAMVAA